VLPKRSALSDLGLIADLLKKMLPNWSSFCLKSLLFDQKCPRSQIFYLSAFQKTQKKNILENFLEYVILSNKVALANVGIRFWEQV
jgi:hypothetical protein